MKIFLSGYTTMQKYLWEDIFKIKYWLSAFPELYKKKDVDELLKYVPDKFLDSWGYSIRMRGLQLSVYDYAKFIKQYWDKFTAIANMDTADVKETLENQRILEWETWKTILPVYHASDFFSGDIEMLENYCNKYKHIAIGWVAGTKTAPDKLYKFLNVVFSKAKQTKTTIHWFWITSNRLLLMYPFYSVDSTSWLSGLRFMTVDYFKQWKMYSMNAGECRKQLWIDIAKLPRTEKIKRSLDARVKYNEYMTKLHQAKWMEYRI